MSKTTRSGPPPKAPVFLTNQDLPGDLVATPIRIRVEQLQTALVSALGNVQTARWLVDDAEEDSPLREAYATRFSIDERDHLVNALQHLSDALEQLYWLQRLPDHVQALVAPDDDEEDALTAAGQPSRPPSDTDTSVAGGVQ